MGKPQLSEGTKNALDEFDAADAKFQQAWALFEERYTSELAQLDALREERNSALDIASRAVREEADLSAEKILKAGPFTAQKKESKLFHYDMLMGRISERDLFDAAKTAKAIEVVVNVDYKRMKAFLEERRIYPDFEDCEDVKPLTTAITGPKAIAPFAAEMKKK